MAEDEKFTEVEGSTQVTPEVTYTLDVAGVVEAEHSTVEDEAKLGGSRSRDGRRRDVRDLSA
jgi:hypothetical protein